MNIPRSSKKHFNRTRSRNASSSSTSSTTQDSSRWGNQAAVLLLIATVTFFLFRNFNAVRMTNINNSDDYGNSNMLLLPPPPPTPSSTGRSRKNNRLSLAELTNNPPAGSIKCSPLMTPVYDRVVQEHEQKTKKKIPNIVHISYNSRCVPTDVFADGIQQWKDQLPEHSVYFHDDDAVDRLLQQDWPEFPEVHRMLNCIKYKGAMKVDLWRMLVVYEFGGFYTDVDNVPAKEFQNGTAIDPEDTFFSSSDTWNRPNQNAFAMEAKHPIASFTVQTILDNLWNMPSLRQPKVVFVTGPDAFRKGYQQYMTLSYPSKSEEDLLKAGVYTGFMNKQIHKETTSWNWLNPVGGEVIEHEGVNMARKTRASQISGMHHWQKKVYKNRRGEDYSCREFLYRLDHPSKDNLVTANWTLNPNDNRVLN